MRTLLTPLKLARAKPKAAPYDVHDSKVPGLYVRVHPSGNKTLYVTWARGRRRAVGKVGAKTIERAREEARQILLDAQKHGEPSFAEMKRADTLKEFFEKHYKPHAEATHKDHAANLRAIEAEFGHLFKKPLKQISQLHLERYRQEKIKAGVKPITINRHFDRIRSLLARAVEWKVIEAHPLRMLKRSKVDRAGVVRFLSEAEEAALRKALTARDERMRAERESANRWRSQRGYPLFPEVPADGFGDVLTPMVLLSMNTGMRRGELRNVRWSDVDLPKAMLTVRGGYAKSGQTRHIPLNLEALDVLRRWRAQSAGAEALFPVLRVDKSWKAVLKAAKIERFRWHDLRHHFASRLVQRGVDLNTVRELLGHADISMTLRYSHLAPEHKAAAVAKLVR